MGLFGPLGLSGTGGAARNKGTRIESPAIRGPIPRGRYTQGREGREEAPTGAARGGSAGEVEPGSRVSDIEYPAEPDDAVPMPPLLSP